ncbi:MAG TPA: nucleotide exchange factor GrpE [Chthoniobacterales bacterium]|nr:nucleotide exchange factor GrpE [Chthoniobacterales bacterium]
MRKIPVTESTDESGAATPRVEANEPKSSASAAEVQNVPTEENEDDNLQADLDRFRDLALRSQADFENYKKRAAREKDEAIKYANSALLEKLIPIVDNFELGLEAARAEGEKSPVFSGMSMVLKQLMDFLKENGLQPIDATGQKFDPNLHEAIAHEPSDEFPEGVVVRQTRRGYRMKDRLLRPSSVAVSSGPAA